MVKAPPQSAGSHARGAGQARPLLGQHHPSIGSGRSARQRATGGITRGGPRHPDRSTRRLRALRARRSLVTRYSSFRRTNRACARQPDRSMPPHNLPAPLTNLVGRQREINAICDLLQRTGRALAHTHRPAGHRQNTLEHRRGAAVRLKQAPCSPMACSSSRSPRSTMRGWSRRRWRKCWVCARVHRRPGCLSHCVTLYATGVCSSCSTTSNR